MVFAPPAKAAFEGVGREETLRPPWAGVAGKGGFSSMLRRIGKPPTLWEEN
jgi:hypothetical protein